jgi:hypothetical protein
MIELPERLPFAMLSLSPIVDECLPSVLAENPSTITDNLVARASSVTGTA